MEYFQLNHTERMIVSSVYRVIEMENDHARENNIKKPEYIHRELIEDYIEDQCRDYGIIYHKLTSKNTTTYKITIQNKPVKIKIKFNNNTFNVKQIKNIKIDGIDFEKDYNWYLAYIKKV